MRIIRKNIEKGNGLLYNYTHEFLLLMVGK